MDLILDLMSNKKQCWLSEKESCVTKPGLSLVCSRYLVSRTSVSILTSVFGCREKGVHYNLRQIMRNII